MAYDKQLFAKGFLFAAYCTRTIAPRENKQLFAKGFFCLRTLLIRFVVANVSRKWLVAALLPSGRVTETQH